MAIVRERGFMKELMVLYEAEPEVTVINIKDVIHLNNAYQLAFRNLSTFHLTLHPKLSCQNFLLIKTLIS